MLFLLGCVCGIACPTYQYGCDLDLESSFVMSNDVLFERLVYVVHVVDGV